MSMSPKKFAIILASGVSMAALAGFATVQGRAEPTVVAAAPVAEVDVAPVVARKVTDWQFYSGRLEAVDRVDVRPQVPGTIVAVHFQNGALVNKGDALFTIDPRPYQAEVARAEAQVAAAEARVRYTAADFDRGQRLDPDRTISRRALDEQENAV
jgi:multidrug efflux system membrane fusion protein